MNERTKSFLIKSSITPIILLGLSLDPTSIQKENAVNVSAMSGVSSPHHYCLGSNCNGCYPADWGCDGSAITVSTCNILIPANVGLNALRYSAICSAFWARTTLSVAGNTIGSPPDRLSLTPDYGKAMGAPLLYNDSVHTMISISHQSCRACGTASSVQPPTLSYSTVEFL